MRRRGLHSPRSPARTPGLVALAVGRVRVAAHWFDRQLDLFLTGHDSYVLLTPPRADPPQTVHL